MTDTAVQNGKVADPEKLLGRIHRVDELRAKGWKLTLDDGAWVQFRDPKTLTEGQRTTFKEFGVTIELLGRKVDEAVMNGNDVMVEALVGRLSAATMRGDRVSIAMFVETWSYAFPVPNVVDTEPLKQVPGPVFDRLSLVSADLLQEAFLDTRVSTKADAPFVESAD